MLDFYIQIMLNYNIGITVDHYVSPLFVNICIKAGNVIIVFSEALLLFSEVLFSVFYTKNTNS